MSDNINKKEIWLVGAGRISVEYLRVLKKFNYKIIIITRSKKRLNDFAKIHKNIEMYHGGIHNFLSNKPKIPQKVIITTNARYLFKITKLLLNFGIKSILVEKPGSLNLKNLKTLHRLIKKKKSKCFIAYNRRFYGSVNYIKKIIKKKKIRSIYFDLTEWIYNINTLNYSKSELNKWFIYNSSHIIDLVFSLIGHPKKLNLFFKDKIQWHKPVFLQGHGISQKNIPFIYRSDWLSFGRWEIRVYFKDFVINLKPIEIVQIEYTKKRKIIIKNFKYEKKFKAGFYSMCSSFINNDYKNLCSFEEQILNFKFMEKILGWRS